MAKTKAKDFFYRFERIPPLNKESIRVKVSKLLNTDVKYTDSPFEPYEVWGSPDEGIDLVCDCPSSQYRAPGGRCKHVIWAEEWLETSQLNEGTYLFSTVDEKFIKL